MYLSNLFLTLINVPGAIYVNPGLKCILGIKLSPVNKNLFNTINKRGPKVFFIH